MLFRTASLFFIVLFILVLPVSVYAQEEVALPPEENSGAVSQTEEIQDEETQTIVEETNETGNTASSSETVDTVIPVEQIPIDVEKVQEVVSATTSVSLVESVDIQMLSKVVASSSVNQSLPFKLVSEKMFFAIQEAPSFTFLYQKAEANPVGFVEEAFTDIVDTVSQIYEGSFVETFVESIVHAVDVVVDFVVTPVEGHEVEGVLHTEEPVIEVQDSVVQEEIVNTVETDSGKTVTTVSSTTVASSTVDTEKVDTVSSVLQSFALVDGTQTTLHVYDDGEGRFTVELEAGVYSVGLHSLELHIFFEQEMHIGYYTFTIEGSVVEMMTLTEDLFAVVVADTSLAQTLWLQKRVSSSTVSWEKIADETTMAQYPTLTFEQGVLFWTTKEKDALLGFDIVSNSVFSQTLNRQSSEVNSIESDTGVYDINVETNSLEVQFIPEPVI